MKGKRIRDYFIGQVGALVDRSTSEPDGFADYFYEREPKDEEILGLIAVATLLSGKYRLAERFPSPAEALASLPRDARLDICNEFRRQLRTCHRQMSLV